MAVNKMLYGNALTEMAQEFVHIEVTECGMTVLARDSSSDVKTRVTIYGGPSPYVEIGYASDFTMGELQAIMNMCQAMKPTKSGH